MTGAPGELCLLENNVFKLSDLLKQQEKQESYVVKFVTLFKFNILFEIIVLRINWVQ